MLIAARDENERLIAIIKVLQRHRFGPRSEKIDPDQLALMLEDVEQAIRLSHAIHKSAYGMSLWATPKLDSGI